MKDWLTIGLVSLAALLLSVVAFFAIDALEPEPKIQRMIENLIDPPLPTYNPGTLR